MIPKTSVDSRWICESEFEFKFFSNNFSNLSFKKNFLTFFQNFWVWPLWKFCRKFFQFRTLVMWQVLRMFEWNWFFGIILSHSHYENLGKTCWTIVTLCFRFSNRCELFKFELLITSSLNFPSSADLCPIYEFNFWVELNFQFTRHRRQIVADLYVS